MPEMSEIFAKENVFLVLGIILLVITHYYTSGSIASNNLKSLKFGVLLWWGVAILFGVATYREIDMKVLCGIALFGSVRATIAMYKQLVKKHASRIDDR